MMFWLVILIYQISHLLAVDIHNYTVRRGETLLFQCVVPNYEKYVCFIHNQTIIAIDTILPKSSLSQTKVAHENDTYTLNFLNITDNHNGTYYCRLCDDSKTFAIFDVIVLSSPSTPKITLRPHQISEHQKVELICEAPGGNPAPHFQWLKFNKTLSISNASIYSTANNSVLTIPEVSAFDNGALFSCAVKNDAIEMPLMTNLTINVVYKPKIEMIFNSTTAITNHSHISLVDGEYASFTAKADANPFPTTLQWSFDNLSIFTGNKLVIDKLNRSMSGNYSFLVANKIGSVSFFFSVSIQFPPKVSILSTLDILNLGDKLEITCIINSKPYPTSIYWQHNSQNITGSFINASSSDYFNNQSILRIQPVNRNDAGQYRCVAENTLLPFNSTARNGVGSANFNLTVKYPPSISISKRKVSAEVGNKVIIHCMAKGVPVPTIEWLRDDYSIPCSYTNVTGDLISCFLSIPVVLQSSFGKYTCKARNILSSDTFDILLTTKKEPDIPSNVTLRSSGYSWIYICWVEGYDGGLPQTFVIETCLKTFYSSANCINVSGIIDSNICPIRIAAKNSIGISKRTKQIEFTVQHFPYEARDMPFLRDAFVDGTDLLFTLSPSKSNLHYSLLCLQIYFSIMNSQPDQNILFDKYEECIELQSENKSSLRSFFSKMSSAMSELRFCVCANERQSICGNEVSVDIRNLPINTRLSSKMIIAATALSAILSAIITFCAICLCKKRHTRRKVFIKKRILKDGRKFVATNKRYLKRTDKEIYSDNMADYKVSLERAKNLMSTSPQLNNIKTTFQLDQQNSIVRYSDSKQFYNDDKSSSPSVDNTNGKYILDNLTPAQYSESTAESGCYTPSKRAADQVIFEATV